MTMNFRTLLPLGLTLLAGSLLGCGGSGGRGNGPPTCLDYQYFDAVWQVDDGGPAVLSCAATPRSHVVLTTNTGVPYAVNGSCYGGSWSGVSTSGIPTGSVVVTGDLIGDPGLVVLSTADVPADLQVPIGYCEPALLNPFGFTIAP